MLTKCRSGLLAFATAFATGAGLARAQEAKGSGTVVLRAARVIDGTGAAPIANGVVVVTEDKIVAVGAQGSVSIPAGARTIDLGDATLLPGFIDAHTHIIGRELNDPQAGDAAVKDFDAMGAIIGVANARKTLLAGFTTIRNVGAPDFDDMALRKAVTEGFVIGPRMQNAGHAIGITGGHCDENGYKPGLMDGNPRTGVADGPDQIRAAVRYQAKYGADVIKTCATGGDATSAATYSVLVNVVRGRAGLPAITPLQAGQCVTLDKTLLTERVGKIPRAKHHLLLAGIDVVLGR